MSPNSKVEFNDRFESFIDHVMREEKEIILMVDFNKNLINEEIETEWSNFPTPLGLSQLIRVPTGVNIQYINWPHLYKLWRKYIKGTRR